MKIVYFTFFSSIGSFYSLKNSLLVEKSMSDTNTQVFFLMLPAVIGFERLF